MRDGFVAVFLLSLEEVRQDIVFIRCTDQLANRQTDLLGIGPQILPKFPVGTVKLTLSPAAIFSRLHQLSIGIDAMKAIWHQTANIHGVGGWKLQFIAPRDEPTSLCLLNLLDIGLGIVKDCHQWPPHMRIGTCLRRRAALGPSFGTILRIKERWFPVPGTSAKPAIAACVPRSRRQNGNFVFQASVLAGLSSVRQDGQSHVLEGNGRSVESSEFVLTIQLDQGKSQHHQTCCRRHGWYSGQLFFRKIVQKCRQKTNSCFLIGSVFGLAKSNRPADRQWA